MASAIDQVREHEARRMKVMLAADVEGMRALFAENMAYVHSTGRLDTRETYLNGFASGVRYTRLDAKEQRILMQGDDAAIVMSDVNMAVKPKDKPAREVFMRSTAVWVRDGAAWQMISVCSTIIQ